MVGSFSSFNHMWACPSLKRSVATGNDGFSLYLSKSTSKESFVMLSQTLGAPKSYVELDVYTCTGLNGRPPKIYFQVVTPVPVNVTLFGKKEY